MWLLISENGELFHITPQEEHVVSRKGGSLTLTSDQSISRQHAKVILKSDDQNDPSIGITLIDTSKYGTYLNDGIESSVRINTNEEIVVKTDDLIRFGLQWHKWRVIFMPFIVMTSMIKKQQKTEVKCQIDKLGGTFVSNWTPSCTHLTMNQVSLTIKVVCALAAGQYIVTPQYWTNLLQAVESKNGNLPDPSDFVPPLNEPTLNENQVSFQVNKQRSCLFKSLVFVTSSARQKEFIEVMVTAGGGKVIEFSECKYKKERFCQQDVILMQSTNSLSSPGGDSQSQISPEYQEYTSYITSKGLRCIPESDIGLSVVYCSCEKFCNPKYKFQNVFEHQPVLKPQSAPTMILAKDTEENSDASRVACTGKVIDETVISDVSKLSGRSNKRLMDEDSEEEKRPFKKPIMKKGSINKDDIIEKPNHTDTTLPKVSNNEQNERICIGDSDDVFISKNGAKSNQMDTLPNVTSSKQIERICISDSDDFCFSKNGEKSNRMDTLPGVTSDRQNERICIDDGDDFSFSKNVKKSMKETVVLNKEPCRSSNPPENNCAVLPSVDMFTTSKYSAKDVQKKSDDGVCRLSMSSAKKSVDLFDVSNNKRLPTFDEGNDFIFETNKSNKKKKRTISLDDDEDDFSFSCSKSKKQIKPSAVNYVSDSDNDDDFAYKVTKKGTSTQSRIETSEDIIPATIETNNAGLVGTKNHEIVKVKGSMSKNTLNTSKQSVIDNPFQSGNKSDNRAIKTSEDIFQPSTSGVKRSSFLEDSEDIFSLKKPKMEINENDGFQNNTSVEIFCDNDTTVKHIKQEQSDFVIKDEQLHDSTVVLVKSLVVSIREINITNTSVDVSNNSTQNFKKFRKATHVKMPVFIDLVPYEEDDGNDSGGKADSRFANLSDSDLEEDEKDDDGGWSYKRTQTLKQNRSKVK